MREPGRTRRGRRVRECVLCALLVFTFFVAGGGGAGAQSNTEAQRIADRIRALEDEAAALAGQARTLIGELRTLEIERDLRAREAKQAEQELAEARQRLDETEARLAALEAERTAQLPGLQAQLVDLYKRGRSGYAHLLFAADDLRDLARATRAAAALARINERRLDEYRRTVEALAAERTALEETTRDLEVRQAAAIRARAAASKAVAAHAELIRQIDSRRDLNAQYTGELRAAYDRLQQQVAALDEAGTAAGPPVAPIEPFHGALEWPVSGRVTGRFGQASNRLGGTAIRNGIEIAAPEGTPVRAVHGGTVGYAEPFTGFGLLVVLDHGGGDYSLYGYLDEVDVERGQTVESGAGLGRVGRAPAGPSALYFELRIDGRSVDPLQWLKAR